MNFFVFIYITSTILSFSLFVFYDSNFYISFSFMLYLTCSLLFVLLSPIQFFIISFFFSIFYIFSFSCVLIAFFQALEGIDDEDDDDVFDDDDEDEEDDDEDEDDEDEEEGEEGEWLCVFVNYLKITSLVSFYDLTKKILHLSINYLHQKSSHYLILPILLTLTQKLKII